MSVKEQAPFPLRPCDRNPKTNSSFLETDSSDKVPIHATLNNVCGADFWKRSKHENLFKEFKFACELCSAGKFITDHDKIALDSPELELGLVFTLTLLFRASV
jgi:hypothetical protein